MAERDRDITARDRWLLAGLVVLACGLLLLSASGRSLWIDEHFSVAVAQEKTLSAVISHIIETERRPPLFYLLLFAWSRLVGTSDLAWRVPSILWTLLLVPLTAQTARLVRLPPLLGTLLLVLSPFTLLFAPMIRPYTMTAALSLASTIAFLSWKDSAGRRYLVAYVLLAALLIWTDYSGLGIIAAQNILALLFLERRRWGQWILAQAALVVLFVPWLGIAAAHAIPPGAAVEADLAGGPLGLALKLAYPLLSYSSGETIFPWDPRGAASLVAVNALAVYGLWGLSRSRGRIGMVGAKHFGGKGKEAPEVAEAASKMLCPYSDGALFAAVYILVPFLFIVALFTFSVPQERTFTYIPSRAMSVYPVLMMVVAAGLAALPRRWAVAAALLVAVGWSAALGNLVAGTHYHNPIYAVRMRAMAATVREQAQPQDVVLSDFDSLFFYYYPDSSPANVFTDAAGVESLLAGAPRVWLVTLGRDRTRVGAAAGAVLDTLQRRGYREQERWGSGPEDPLYQRVKEWLLKRPDYEYKATVQLFVQR